MSDSNEAVDERNIQQIIKSLEDKNEEVRVEAAQLLGNYKNMDAINGLIKALTDPSGLVRSSVVESLGQIGYAGAVAKIIPLLKDEEEFVRVSAAYALGRIEDKKAVPALIKSILDLSPTVRSATVVSLGRLKDPGAFDALVECLQDPEDDVRRETVIALQTIDSIKARPPISKLKSDKIACIRAAAFYSIGGLKGKEALPELMDAFSSDEDLVARSILIFFREQNIIEAYDAIEALLFDNKRAKDLRVLAMDVISSMDRKRSIDALIKCLEDDNPVVKTEAIRYLGLNKDDRIPNLIRKQLNDPDDKIRAMALNAIYWQHRNDSGVLLPVIKNYLKDPAASIVTTAISFLKELGGIDYYYDIKTVINHRDSLVRFTAYDALRHLSKERTEELISTMLNDANLSVRVLAIEGLGYIGNQQSFNMLKEFSREKNYVIRASAFSSLGWFRNKSAFELLLKGLKDKNSYVRAEAARAIGRTGNKNAIRPLLKCLDDVDDYVQAKAIAAFRDLNDISVVPHLKKYVETHLNGRYWERIAAKTAINVIDELKVNQKKNTKRNNTK